MKFYIYFSQIMSGNKLVWHQVLKLQKFSMGITIHIVIHVSQEMWTTVLWGFQTKIKVKPEHNNSKEYMDCDLSKH